MRIWYKLLLLKRKGKFHKRLNSFNKKWFTNIEKFANRACQKFIHDLYCKDKIKTILHRVINKREDFSNEVKLLSVWRVNSPDQLSRLGSDPPRSGNNKASKVNDASFAISLLRWGRFGSPASGEKSTQTSNYIEKYWRKHSKMYSKKCSS